MGLFVFICLSFWLDGSSLTLFWLPHTLHSKCDQGEKYPSEDSDEDEVEVLKLERLQHLGLHGPEDQVLSLQPRHDARLLHLVKLVNKDVQIGAGLQNAPPRDSHWHTGDVNGMKVPFSLLPLIFPFLFLNVLGNGERATALFDKLLDLFYMGGELQKSNSILASRHGKPTALN